MWLLKQVEQLVEKPRKEAVMALTPAEKQRRYRERQKGLGVTEPVTEGAVVLPDEEPPGVTDQELQRPTTLRGLMAAARARTIVLTEREEHLIRRHFGYADSEKRTLLQRDEVALRLAQSSSPRDGTVVRNDADGQPQSERLGPAGLSLVAFPLQAPGDLTPTAEQLAKLG